MAGFRTTAGAKALNASFPMNDSDLVARLRAQGAVFIGKANLDTFAIGGNSTSEVAGQTLNPYGPAVASAGSSSCGNGAGGASVFAVVGVGTDTTGSVLSPSSNQNLIGFNLPYGRVPMRGVFPLSPLLDRAGPLVRYAEDLASALDVLDPTLSSSQLPFYASPQVLNVSGLQGLRIGVLRSAFETYYSADAIIGNYSWNMTSEVHVLFNQTLTNLKSGGATLQMCNITQAQIYELTVDRIYKDYYLFLTCYSTLVDHYLAGVTSGSPYHNASEMLASGLLSSQISQFIQSSLQQSAQCNQTLADFHAFKQNYTQSLIDPLFTACGDLLVSPYADVLPDTGSSSATLSPAVLSFVSGYPQMTLPMGFSAQHTGAPQGLPLGLYATARPGNERLLVRLAYAYQKNFGPGPVLPTSVSDATTLAATSSTLASTTITSAKASTTTAQPVKPATITSDAFQIAMHSFNFIFLLSLVSLFVVSGI